MHLIHPTVYYTIVCTVYTCKSRKHKYCIDVWSIIYLTASAVLVRTKYTVAILIYTQYSCHQTVLQNCCKIELKIGTPRVKHVKGAPLPTAGSRFYLLWTIWPGYKWNQATGLVLPGGRTHTQLWRYWLLVRMHLFMEGQNVLWHSYEWQNTIRLGLHSERMGYILRARQTNTGRHTQTCTGREYSMYKSTKYKTVFACKHLKVCDTGY